MTNSELILRLVEMLLQKKEETMKAKEQQDKAQYQSKQGGFYGATLFLDKKIVCALFTVTHTKNK